MINVGYPAAESTPSQMHGVRKSLKELVTFLAAGPTVEVVAAIIRKGDKVFAIQRGYGEWKDYWEWPGGKTEPGETPEEALKREIREELAAEIRIEKLLTTIDWDYPKFHLTMH